MKELELEITTPSKRAYKGLVKSVTLPGTMGSFQALYNHAPLLSSLEVGKIKIVEENGAEKYFAISGGAVEILNNKVLVLADTFESPQEIDLERAKKSLERGKERVASHSKDIDVDRAKASIARALNRINIYEKYTD